VKFLPTVRLKIAILTEASNSARPHGMVGHLSVPVAATGPGKFVRDSAPNAFFKLSASANDRLAVNGDFSPRQEIRRSSVAG